MEFSAALKNEILRPLGTILIPAAVAIGPAAGFLLHKHPEFLKYYKENTTAVNMVIIPALFVVGMYLENIGSRLEDRFYHKIKSTQSAKAWLAYLLSDPHSHPVALGYIASLVARMKFELSMIPAICLGSSLGLWAAVSQKNIALFSLGFWVWIAFSLGLLYYTFCEARTSVTVLDTQRRDLFCDEKSPT
jgi:hypothetical protein